MGLGKRDTEQGQGTRTGIPQQAFLRIPHQPFPRIPHWPFPGISHRPFPRIPHWPFPRIPHRPFPGIPHPPPQNPREGAQLQPFPRDRGIPGPRGSAGAAVPWGSPVSLFPSSPPFLLLLLPLFCSCPSQLFPAAPVPSIPVLQEEPARSQGPEFRSKPNGRSSKGERGWGSPAPGQRGSSLLQAGKSPEKGEFPRSWMWGRRGQSARPRWIPEDAA